MSAIKLSSRFASLASGFASGFSGRRPDFTWVVMVSGSVGRLPRVPVFPLPGLPRLPWLSRRRRPSISRCYSRSITRVTRVAVVTTITPVPFSGLSWRLSRVSVSISGSFTGAIPSVVPRIFAWVAIASVSEIAIVIVVVVTWRVWSISSKWPGESVVSAASASASVGS